MKPIESDRLRISPWSIDDLSDAIRLWGDPEVMKFIDIRGGLNHEQVRDKLNQEIDRQTNHGVQYWKVSLKSAGAVIGCCGLRPYDLEKRIYEIGFHIMSAYWGKGFATEAANAVIRYAFETMKVPKLFAGHNPKNLASKNMLEKLGFRFVREELYEPTGLLHPSYELANPEVELQ